MRPTILTLIFLVNLWGQRIAQPLRVDPNSSNKCPAFDVPLPFRWTVMASRPVDLTPITNYQVLQNFLAPTNVEAVQKEKATPTFDKPWQILAKQAWGWTDSELNLMWMAALQGEGSNWRREMIAPCEILGDMMYGIPPAVVGRPTLVDFKDNGAREAWVFPLRAEVEAVFFKDCSNPTWRAVVIKPVSETPVRRRAEEAKPAPPPKIDVHVPAPVVNVAAPVVNVPPGPPPQVTVNNEHPVTNNHPVTVNVPPAKVSVTVKRELSGLEKWYYGTGILGNLAQGWQGFEQYRIQKRLGHINNNLAVLARDLKIPGSKGDTGAQGQAGFDGKNGLDGKDGPAGKDGLNGKDGKDGLAGPTGATGPQGPGGTTGATGPTGSTGATGLTGATGPTGPRGPAGPQGPGGIGVP
ncbi:MAG: hypothetical protein Q8R08_02675, partial [bacterium]|nr:hypothetical protein [bacterium]